MRAVFLLAAICEVAVACTHKTEIPTDFPTPPPQVTITPLKKMELKRDQQLEAQMVSIAENAKGRVGASAVLMETAQGAELNGGEQFPMQSVYKLPIAMAVLFAEGQDKLSLDEKVAVEPSDFVRPGVRSPLRDDFPKGGEFTIRELLAISMAESDGTASDVLMQLAGGPGSVEEYLHRLGITEMYVRDSEKGIFKDWQTQYRNSASPRATIELLRALQTGGGLSDESRRELLYVMEESGPGSRRIKHLLPKETVVAHKTGTGGNRNGIAAATNDVGIITLPNGQHILLAVYIADSSADAGTREKIIAEIAKAAWDRWTTAQ
jgi:beta-lactamase class A